MPIPMNATCMECFLNKRLEKIRSYGTPEQATLMAKEMLNMLGQSGPEADSALLGGLVDARILEFFGITEDVMAQEKEMSNRFVLERIDSIRSRIQSAKDPLFAGLQYAILGNYLDFAALYGKVSFEALDEMLESAGDMALDMDCYRQFCQDLQTGKSLLYITDNAGEIVFDRLFAETIAEKFPHLQITFLVRGENVANDATRVDAAAACISFPVIDSGYAIGGTALNYLSQEAKDALYSADVVLAKGMGNTESLYGCGCNVYFAFLVKCARLAEFFDAPLMKPLFVRERA